MARAAVPQAEALAAMLQAMRPPRDLSAKLFLTLREAAEFTGLRPVYLKGLIASGKLKPITVNGQGSRRIRRKDLEKL